MVWLAGQGRHGQTDLEFHVWAVPARQHAHPAGGARELRPDRHAGRRHDGARNPRCGHGAKDAEHAQGARRGANGITPHDCYEIAVWLAVFVIGVIAAVLFVARRDGKKALAVGVAAVLVLLALPWCSRLTGCAACWSLPCSAGWPGVGGRRLRHNLDCARNYQ